MGLFWHSYVATFVQEVGLTWIQGGLLFRYSGHKCYCWLKIVDFCKHDYEFMLAEKRKDGSELLLIGQRKQRIHAGLL